MKSELVANYCTAVDESGHPIQRLAPLLPENGFRVGLDLYEYSVCAYLPDGTPLGMGQSVHEAAWVIFDNVYIRISGGRFPTRRDRLRAAAAGFKAKGKYRTPMDAARLWEGVSRMFGLPAEFDRPVEQLLEPMPVMGSDPAPPVPRIAPQRLDSSMARRFAQSAPVETSNERIFAD